MLPSSDDPSSELLGEVPQPDSSQQIEEGGAEVKPCLLADVTQLDRASEHLVQFQGGGALMTFG